MQFAAARRSVEDRGVDDGVRHALEGDRTAVRGLEVTVQQRQIALEA
jgi:hypothetical protein